MATRKVLVTGCSSGIGLAVAVQLARDKLRRFEVVATLRNLEKRQALERAAGETLNKTLEIQQLDACCEHSIRECLKNLPGGQVDVLGLLFNDVYAASKFAVEGFCESLAVQAMKFNVKMTLVEPGPVVTEFEKKVYEDAEHMDLSGTDEETAQIFRGIYLPYSRKIFSSIGQAPEEIAKQTLELIVANDPPFRHQTNPLYTPMTALKHADPSGRLPLETFYKMIFRHDRVFNASLGLLRLLQKRTGRGAE
ncbi:retinol dehydrogenase 8 isoform X2 [Denticeps clupeoides]|uniref:retinol dehydrogenase 8 isoform X2 n=1 Tax=Denticeps clupeoides TaxID=299321 RepID=UPI0010A2F2E3|nr:retinol dehydrogenase 8-like isoform X2 [Denticeps clupeoides]